MNTNSRNPSLNSIYDTPALMGAMAFVVAVGGASLLATTPEALKMGLPSFASRSTATSEQVAPQVATDTSGSEGHAVYPAVRAAESLSSALYVHQQVRAWLPESYKSQAPEVARAVLEESRRAGLDPLLVLAVIRHESRFSPDTRGSHGEIGLMQIKPSTAAWLAQRAGLPKAGARANWIRILSEPAANVRIGVAYLAMLKERYRSGGSLFLSAYNMGATKLNQVLGQKRTPRTYASKVLSNYISIYADYHQRLNRNEASLPVALVAWAN